MILIGVFISGLAVSCEGFFNDSDIMDDMSGWLPIDVTHFTTVLQGTFDPQKYMYHPVVEPIYTSNTYHREATEEEYGYDYSRINNPNRESLEGVIAKLDDAEYATTYPSGMAAIHSTLAMLRPGDHIVCPYDVYHGTHRYINEGADFQVTYVEPTIDEYMRAIKRNTKMVWVESPSNPLLKVTDVPRLARAVRRVNQDIIIVLDNSLMGPFFQRGLNMGVDVVVYSLSKYLNGHGDVISGAAVTNDMHLHAYFLDRQQSSGLVPSPFDCHQILRGLKTYPIRMVQHWKNALRIAKWLETHPFVEEVIYPGLKSQSILAKTMMSGMSGVLSFKLRDFDLDTTKAVLANLKYFASASSLGQVESLAEQPYVMLETSLPEDLKTESGITPNLIRLSVGLEYHQDLIDDLDQAMRSTSPKKTSPTNQDTSPERYNQNEPSSSEQNPEYERRGQREHQNGGIRFKRQRKDQVNTGSLDGNTGFDGGNRYPRFRGAHENSRSAGDDENNRFSGANGNARFRGAAEKDRFSEPNGDERFRGAHENSRSAGDDENNRFSGANGNARFRGAAENDRFSEPNGSERFRGADANGRFSGAKGNKAGHSANGRYHTKAALLPVPKHAGYSDKDRYAAPAYGEQSAPDYGEYGAKGGHRGVAEGHAASGGVRKKLMREKKEVEEDNELEEELQEKHRWIVSIPDEPDDEDDYFVPHPAYKGYRGMQRANHATRKFHPRSLPSSDGIPYRTERGHGRRPGRWVPPAVKRRHFHK